MIEKFYLCCVYLPPLDVHALTSFISGMDRIGVLCSGTPIVICGDFNRTYVEWSLLESATHLEPVHVDNASASLIDSVNFMGLMQFNHIRNVNGRLLDLIFSDRAINDVCHCDQPLVREDLHHPSLEFLVDVKDREDLRGRPSACLYNFRKAPYEAINTHLQGIPWSDFFERHDLHGCVEIFYSILQNTIQTFVPLKKLHKKYPIYFTSATVHVIKTKNKAHKRWKKSGNQSDYNTFKCLRSRSKRLIAADFSRFTKSVETQLPSNPKRFWHFVSAARRGGGGVPAEMRCGDIVADGGTDICNLFASYFKSVFIQPSGCDFHHNHLPKNNLKLSQIVVTPLEVFNKISKLDSNKGAGPDGIPTYFISKLAVSLQVPLSLIYNTSLLQGSFPDKWKQAAVVPILKNGSKAEVSNYRPISILNVLAKVFESLVYDRLYHHIENQIILEQHGFVRRRCIDTNLMSYTEFLHDALDVQIQVDAVYTDFRKAFDKIDHNILLSRIAAVGVHGGLLRWFESYLENRSQFVALLNYRSSSYPMTSGVPQGSHLGPLLFNIFINNIKVCFKHSKFLLYADDLKVYKRINSIEDSMLLQSDLNRLCKYCQDNLLFLNLEKCHSVTFSRNITTITHIYQLLDTNISRLGSVKDLGVVFDSKLLFNLHIEAAVTSASKMLGFVLRQSRYFTDVRSVVLLYNAFVLGRLSFGSCVWNPRYNIYINRIESIQNRLLRFLAFRRGAGGTHDYALLRGIFCLRSLEQRRHASDICMLYKIIHGYVQVPYILEKVVFNVPPSINLRRTPLFVIPFRHTNAAQNSPLCRMLRSFESDASGINIYSTSLSTLRRLLKNS